MLTLKATKLYLYNFTFIMLAFSTLASSSLGCSSINSSFILPTYAYAKESGGIQMGQAQFPTISLRPRFSLMTNLLIEGCNIQFQIKTFPRLIFISYVHFISYVILRTTLTYSHLLTTKEREALFIST